MIRYGLFGVLANLILYLLFLGMLAAGIGPYLSQLASFLAGTLLAFFLNRNFTFADDRPISATLPRYILLYGGCYLLNALSLGLLLHAGLPPWLGQAICVVLSAVGLFFAQKALIFGKR